MNLDDVPDRCGGSRVLLGQEPGDPRPLYCSGCDDCLPPSDESGGQTEVA